MNHGPPTTRELYRAGAILPDSEGQFWSDFDRDYYARRRAVAAGLCIVVALLVVVSGLVWAAWS